MHPLLQSLNTPEQRAELEAAFGLPPRAVVGRGVTRRAVLAGGAGTGLLIAVGGLLPSSAMAAAPGPEGAATGLLAPNQFVRVGTDNLVTIVCKHHEMGQGNATGLASMAADELDADWSLVRTEFAPADAKLYANLAFGMQGTGGSSAISNSYLQMRSAGATARAMLVAAAAEAWKVPASEIKASKSVLTHASGKRATYGEMAAAAAKQTPPANPVLKTPAQFTLMGKSDATPRVDSLEKCTGKATYTIDVKLPGLLTAVIAWPPSFGAKLVSFDAADAKKVKGVTDVVQVPEGVAVVATGTWAALQGRRALKVVWDEAESGKLDSDALLAQYKAQAATAGKPFARPAKDAPAAQPVAKTVEAVYEFPFLAHATMEPMNCVAWLHDGMLETWSGHQFPTFDHMFAAKAAGLPMEKVKLHTLVSGGSFGRRANAYSDFTVAAVNVAKAINGRAPVRLQYSREDDMAAGLYRPMYVHAVRAGLDAQGQIAGWQHTVVGQSIMAGTAMEMMVKDGIDPTSVEGVSPSIYALPMLSADLHTTTAAPKPLWWRSVGNTHTAYVMETMMDELARAAGRDPLAFRLALLGKSDRAAGVLKLAADKAGWGKPTRAGMAQGLAVHESFGSFVAQVADVSMKDGKVKVERVVCAVDCGIAVNPDVIKAQMEGCIGFALGALYYGEVEVKNGRAAQRNFDTYKSLRIHEMPKVEVYIVPSTVAPSGVGEPGVPPLAPAVANAVARLGGPMVRRLPFARAGLVEA
ncbi:xanthine dehydrogenase family protein molybdopterin-binding subunit [Rhizobacter sp. Root404]|uniref:xanthine dehydrogenase family protein molybdopterin-binding subunit n=1 Tax=Rhizobacter sp. Root404 TaxID=1736528 RepID=UPI0009E82F32|nr:xanthine dehydrogenase family protein molybdopterin-binding subunit [Rhizobacter sp. Root404]